MACCILILLYVYDEMSYDRFNKNSNRIYRVVVDGSLGDNSFKVAVTSPPLRKTLLQDYPEVEAVTRIRNFGFPVLRFADKVFSEEKFSNQPAAELDPRVAGVGSLVLRVDPV